MTRRELENDDQGTVATFDDTAEERDRRIDEWAREVAELLILTPGQAKRLARHVQVTKPA